MTAPMHRPRRLLPALAVAFFCAAGPAAAGEEADPFAKAEEGMRDILAALELLIATIPHYEMPEVLENGDIIIRRVQPKPERLPENADGDGIVETTI